MALVIGLVAGWLQGGRFDSAYRFTAFLGLSIPPFILGLFLISVFYVGLHWFPLGRTGIYGLLYSPTSDFVSYTGFLTIDGLLNGRLDVTIDAADRIPMVNEGSMAFLKACRPTTVRCFRPRAFANAI